jgi:signal transduction histidine kinase
VEQITVGKTTTSILALTHFSDVPIAVVIAIMYLWRRYWILLFAAVICTSAFESDLKITQFSHAAWGANQDAPPRILAIAQTTDEYLWIGAAEGLFRFDGLTFERYQTQPEPALPSGAVVSLLALPNGDLWIGFYSGAISLLRNGHAVNYGKADGVPRGYIDSLAQDETGAIWAGWEYGLVRLENNRWKEVGREWNFHGTAARSIYFDRAGTLWVATENTIVFLPKGTRTFQPTGIDVGQVSQIVEAPNGKLWMAETSRSVRPVPLHSKLAPSDETEVHMGASQILFAREGDLWIPTLGDGLRRVRDPETLQGKHDRSSPDLERYTTQDGLSSNYDLSIFQDRDGNIWVGSDRGLDRFRETASVGRSGLSRNPRAKLPLIESIVADGQSYVRWTDDLKLPAGIKNVQINYTVPSLTDPYRAHFRYKLDGFDTDWQDAGTRRTAHYMNIGPGKYRFRVIAGDLDGAWSPNAAVIDFTIPPFWFQTAWFRTLLGLIGIGLIYLLHTFRLRQATAQVQARLEERLEERGRIARELHDTLIQSVDGLMLYLQAAIDEPDPQRSHQMLEKALDRADEALSEGRERVHTLRTEAMTADDLPQALSIYGTERAQDHAIEFSVTLVGNPRPLDPIVQDEAFRIGREALANAFQHSGASKIEVELTYDRIEIRLRIRDDGNGIDPGIVETGKPGHWGLSGMRERANQVGATLNIWSRLNAGTEIDLAIPARVAYQRRFRIFPLSLIGGKEKGERS